MGQAAKRAAQAARKMEEAFESQPAEVPATEEQKPERPSYPVTAPQTWAPTEEKPRHYASSVDGGSVVQGYVSPTLMPDGETVLSHAARMGYKRFRMTCGASYAVGLHAFCSAHGLPAQAAVVLAYVLQQKTQQVGLYFPSAPYTRPGEPWKTKFAAAPFTKTPQPPEASCRSVEAVRFWANHFVLWVQGNTLAREAYNSVDGLPALELVTPE